MSAPFEEGADFPDLALWDAQGRETRLGDEMAGRPTVLYFLRSADCSVCRNHLRTLARRKEDLDAFNARALSIVPDGSEAALSLERWIGGAVPVFSGAGPTAHQQAGLAPTFFGRLQPSGTVLLRPSRKVAYARHAALPPLGYREGELFDALLRCAGPRA